MKKQPKAMKWFTVRTDHGIERTLAVSAAQAKRNARYRLVMGKGCNHRPTPRELGKMRDIEVIECFEDGE